MMFTQTALKIALLKGAIVLLPSYTAAYITEQMVWVMPAVVAAGFIAGSLTPADDTSKISADTDFSSGADSGSFAEEG